jgi:uncharacterized protein YbjT (DUF2867 family)
MGKLAITGVTGKLGGAVLDALLEHEMFDPNDLVIATTSKPDHPKFTKLASGTKGIHVRTVDFDRPTTLKQAFVGCDTLLLVSSPAINLDTPDAAVGEGRERHHFNAINAAREAGVRHIYYTSLAFAANDGMPGSSSKASVMRAHLRTEEYLQKVWESAEEGDFDYTIIREGLYAESWPLYFGFYDSGRDEREEVYVAGDGPICWTTIPDLAYATARIITAPSAEYAGRTFYLSNIDNPKTLTDVAELLGKKENRKIQVKTVSTSEFQEFYVKEGKEGVRGVEWLVEWWSSTYGALADGECLIKDRTLAELLHKYGREMQTFESSFS